jgi:hypothetical protein
MPSRRSAPAPSGRAHRRPRLMHALRAVEPQEPEDSLAIDADPRRRVPPAEGHIGHDTTSRRPRRKRRALCRDQGAGRAGPLPLDLRENRAVDNTVMIALITASAGVAGGLTTGLVGALTTDRHDNKKWARELAEKDRERLYQLFEDIVAKQRELILLLVTMAERPLDAGAHSDVWQTMSDVAQLCARARILGAEGVSSRPLHDVVETTHQRIRDRPAPLDPLDRSGRFDLVADVNTAAGQLRVAMSENMKRLRTEDPRGRARARRHLRVRALRSAESPQQTRI